MPLRASVGRASTSVGLGTGRAVGQSAVDRIRRESARVAATVEAPIAGLATVAREAGRRQDEINREEKAEDKRRTREFKALKKAEAKAIAKLEETRLKDQQAIENGNASAGFDITLAESKAAIELESQKKRLTTRPDADAAKKAVADFYGKMELPPADAKTTSKMLQALAKTQSEINIGIEDKLEADGIALAVEYVRTLANVSAATITDSGSLFRETASYEKRVNDTGLTQTVKNNNIEKFNAGNFSALVETLENEKKFDAATALLNDPRASGFVDGPERGRLGELINTGREQAKLKSEVTEEEARRFFSVVKGDDASVHFDPKRDATRFNKFFDKFVVPRMPDPIDDPKGYRDEAAFFSGNTGLIPNHILSNISRPLRVTGSPPEFVVNAALLYDAVAGKNSTLLNQIPSGEQKFADNILALIHPSSGLSGDEAVGITRESQAQADGERDVREVEYKKLTNGRGSSETNTEFLEAARGEIDVPLKWFDADVKIPPSMQASFDKLTRDHFLLYGDLPGARKWALRTTLSNWSPSGVEDVPRWMINSPESVYARYHIPPEELRKDYIAAMTKDFPGYSKDPTRYQVQLNEETLKSDNGPGFFVFELDDSGRPNIKMGVSKKTGKLIPVEWRPGVIGRRVAEAPKVKLKRADVNRKIKRIAELEDERRDLTTYDAPTSRLKSFVDVLGGN